MEDLDMQALPRRDGGATQHGAMDANHAAIALATAMNEARAALSGRDEAAVEARASGVARLQALRGKLAPLYAAIPRDVELFDLGFVSPEKPRLFVDIIAFVEAFDGDAGYRFVQESRSGRSILLETRDESELIAEITRYVAHRLVVRERALAQVEDSPPGPLIRQPAPLVPMTAEEAFRQWTRGTQTRSEPGDSVRTWIQEPRHASPGQAPSTHAPVETSPNTGSATEAPAESRQQQPSSSGPHDLQQEASHRSRLQQWPEATPQANRKRQGWWLWPTMALLIGGGLGTLVIYLYASKLT